MAVIAVAVLVLVLAAVLSGPVAPTVHVEPEVTFALPPTSLGCGGETVAPDGVIRMPLTVSTVAGQTAETVNVCIGGRGPYPFVLDSGAGQSTIDAGLAKRLHLTSDGAPSVIAGVGCTGSARPVASGSWSLEGIALDPQQLTAATLPQIGGKGEPMGLLGSDVLARFGAVRIDFAARALLLAGSEGATISATSDFTGPRGPAPVALTLGQGTTVPVTVSPQTGAVSLSTAVRFAHGGPSELRDRHGLLTERRVNQRGPQRLLIRNKPGPAPGHGVLGHHRPAGAQRHLVQFPASSSIPSSSERPISAALAPAASTACSAPTSSCATAGSCSTTPVGVSSWAERDVGRLARLYSRYSGPDNPNMSVTPWSRPAV